MIEKSDASTVNLDVPILKKLAKNIDTPVIVGVGASAGGLEALELFFTHLPPESGVAFVVIQHMDPTHPAMLSEILQGRTLMKVVEASDDDKASPNCVYVIPPNKDLSIIDGHLHLINPVAERGFRLPIDDFFIALAKDQTQHAVGIILSGMGSDGSLGLAAIKQNGGLTVVQSPDSAKFDSMPINAINMGCVDIITEPQMMWNQIVNLLNQRLVGMPSKIDPILTLKSQSALEQIIILLRERTGNNFSLYKKNTIYRRIERRMALHKIESIATYVDYLRNNQQELDLLFKELLIGVTQFFRDPTVWDVLKKDVLTTLLLNYNGETPVRAWVAACSTGEEAYSLAIVFKEALASLDSVIPVKLQIFATDLDQDAIEIARRGFYSNSIKADISTDRLEKFFTADGNGYRINKEIREMVIFAPQNIAMDPPFTKLDILCCRNLLIYLNQELQNKLIPLFYYTLNNNGVLLLGNAETISGFNHLFSVIDNKSRLYRQIPHTLPVGVDFPTKYSQVLPLNQTGDVKLPGLGNFQTLAEQLLLQRYTPAAVIVNNVGDILFISGRTGKYLEPAAGKANWNIHAMAREGLRFELSAALKQAQHQTEAVKINGIKIESHSDSQLANLTVELINKPEALSGMLIVIFTDTPRSTHKKSSGPVDKLEHENLQNELQRTREQLQSTYEEMQSSQEELRSTNEELQSTNEELQSSNEELVTSKEEMQSLNEELQTVNAQLQTKLDDLSRASNDLNNLLNSMEIATVFLDNALNIRRFTSNCTKIFKLISSDLGRPLSDISNDLEYPQLQQDVEEVLRTLIFKEQQIKASTQRWFKVRIMPYRTHDNIIDGVVITFIDISETKHLEAQLRDHHE
jgi:chemotaxis protein methyltransferase CheR/two-component system CheB/CheR fusion protein